MLLVLPADFLFLPCLSFSCAVSPHPRRPVLSFILAKYHSQAIAEQSRLGQRAWANGGALLLAMEQTALRVPTGPPSTTPVSAEAVTRCRSATCFSLVLTHLPSGRQPLGSHCPQTIRPFLYFPKRSPFPRGLLPFPQFKDLTCSQLFRVTFKCPLYRFALVVFGLRSSLDFGMVPLGQ